MDKPRPQSQLEQAEIPPENYIEPDEMFAMLGRLNVEVSLLKKRITGLTGHNKALTEKVAALEAEKELLLSGHEKIESDANSIGDEVSSD